MFLMRLDYSEKDRWSEMHERLNEFGIASGLFSDIRIKRHGKKLSDPFQLQVKVKSGSHASIMDVGYGVIPFQIHNHPRCAFQAAAALTIAQSRLMMDVMRAGCSEKYVHAWSTALRASSTVGKSLFARKFDFK